MADFTAIQGDCIPALARLTSHSIRATLIFADPPYNLDLDYGATTDDHRPRPEYLRWCRRWISECYVNLHDHGSIWVLINHENAADLEIIVRDTGFTIRDWITWYETFGVNATNKFSRSSRRLFHAVKNPRNYIFNRASVTRPSARQEIYHDQRAHPAGRLWDDVWGVNPAIPRLCGTHRERQPGFPTQLPLKLLYPVISCGSHPGDLVLDPFGGSGTTSLACLDLDRPSIYIEINPHYHHLATIRLEEHAQAKLKLTSHES